MAPDTVSSERRQKARKSPPSLIYVELGSGNGGMVRDLSADGLAVRAMAPMRVGEQIPFSFALDANVRAEGRGEILWTEENGRVAGLRFLDLPDEIRRQIENWLNGTVEKPEEAQRPGVAEAQSFEELREQLRAPEVRAEPAVRHPHWAIPRPNAAPPPAAESVAQRQATVTEKIAEQQAPVAEPPVQEPSDDELPVEPIAFPELSHFAKPDTDLEKPTEPARAANAPSFEMPTSFEAREEEPSFAESRPGFPDISEILMQPQQREGGDRGIGLHSLDPLEQAAVKEGSWTDWFTLTRVVAIMAVLAASVAGSVYHREFGRGLIWLGQQLSGGQTAPAAAPTRPDSSTMSSDAGANGAAPVPSDSAPATSSQSGTNTNVGPTANLSPPVSKPTAAIPAPARNSSPALPPLPETSSTGASETETGLTEYSHALQLLRNKNSDADLSEAVRLLWVSVEKGNPSAELTLAELYWRGEGVARNCDQTRILLSAAARKGNPDAEKRLRQFQQEGCE